MPQKKTNRKEERENLQSDELMDRLDVAWKSIRAQTARIKELEKKIKELEAKLKAKIPKIVLSKMDLFIKFRGKLVEVSTSLVVGVQLWWGATDYPHPGERFWGAEWTFGIMVMAAASTLTLMLMYPALKWGFIVMVVAILAAYVGGAR